MDQVDQAAAGLTSPSEPQASPLDSSPPRPCALLALPSELMDAILSNLEPHDLAIASSVCRALRKHALSDVLWQPLVQQNVPGVALASPSPCASFKDLYAAHDRTWFLPRYKLWFCDRDMTGKLILVRYDPRRGIIEGYRLLAVRQGTAHAQVWSEYGDVVIHGFKPRVMLHLDKPVVQFRIRDPSGGGDEDDGGFSTRPGANRYADEMPMELDDRLGALFSNFMLARTLPPGHSPLARDVWPPLPVPASQRVQGFHEAIDMAVNRSSFYMAPEHRPRRRADVFDRAFRVRQWMEMAGSPAAGLGGVAGIHLGEELITYSTLDPYYYTPTRLKPWRGIWVGDYSDHGCEFILMHQPDDKPGTDDEINAELLLERRPAETDEQWEKRRLDAMVYRGRLSGVKLTGDPNVPRGEYTFIAPDLGPKGHVGMAIEPPFEGVRIVRSRGHVAGTGFIDDKFIDSQLLLISHDRLAQHWLGHVSYFQRVNIDQFLKI